MKPLSLEQARIVYSALRQHDGGSMCPWWPVPEQKALTEALDTLRGLIYSQLPDDKGVAA